MQDAAGAIADSYKIKASELEVTRPVGRAPKFLFSLSIVVSVVIIVVSSAVRDNIDARMRRHYLDTAVALTAVGVDPDTTWADAKT
jgi:hypothetical protein